MKNYAKPLERAFEPAKSGRYTSITGIKDQLARERISTEPLIGGMLLRQLRVIMGAASATKALTN